MSEMGCRMSRELKILPSMCDSKSLLAIPAVFDTYQNMATLHADHFEIGPEGMKRRNSFWVITKTRIHIDKLPEMMDDVTVNTWIQAPERASCERDFDIVLNGERIIYGRSIWAVISRDTGRLVHMAGLYPELDFTEPVPDDKPFARISKNFDGAETIGEYTIRSVDIDLGGHMNNVNYIRAMLGCFTTEQLAALDIHEIEVNFISQSYEGQTLTFARREVSGEDGSHAEIAALDHEGKAVFIARLS
ncbi:MAG: hypothetical protein IKE85_06815 [Mogibacterium sp.]|nr:hypothetical protein [Mogibacterium sp.]